MSTAAKAIFISYASQDAVPVRRICEALRASDVEVWFDQSELVGGDTWDREIRRQLRECAMFAPIISANTQARREGYFRIEWKLAAQRTHAIADGTPFLLPIVIDDTREADALVPEEFRTVQWTRLPGGETSPAFCARVKKLLSPPDVGPVDDPGPASARPATTQPKVGRRVPAPAWIAAAVVALGVAGFVALRPTPNAGAGTRPPATEKSVASLSEARKLVAKARPLFENPAYTRDDLTLAEDYCKQALKLDPNDAEVWAISAEVSSEFIGGRTDLSPERIELARTQSERAVKLDPQSVEARFAKASFLRRVGGAARLEAEKILRELAVESSGDPRVLIGLGKVIWGNIGAGTGRSLERGEEALALFARAAAIPAGRAEALGESGWLLLNLRRYTEAEAAIDESLRLRMSKSAIQTKVRVALERGDLPAARAALTKIPDDLMRSDAGASLAALVWLFSGQPDKCLETLSAIPRDYLSSDNFRGPTDLFRGFAYRLADKKQAATSAWQAALQVVGRRLVEQPRDDGLLFCQAYLLALLGQRDAASTALRLYEEIHQPDPNGRNIDQVALHAQLDPDERVLDMLEVLFKGRTAASLKNDFRFSQLRGNSRFEALIARDAPGTAAARPDQKSIAVLAFKAIGDDKESQYFSEGISEELLNVLATVPGLRVAARASAFHFKDKNATTQEMGRQLNVAYLVEGSVQSVGTTARVTARLSRAESGEQIWSGKFEGELKNILALQDEIAGRIADNLKLKLAGGPRAARIVNPEAHQLLLEGRYFWNLRTTDGFTQAEAAIVKAIALDPEFAPAHAALADVCLMRTTYTLQDGTSQNRVAEDIARARAEAQRAIDLDPALPDAYPALAQCSFLEMRFAEAEQYYQKALQLNPNNAVAHAWHSILLLSQGYLDRGLLELERAAALDPLWAVNLTTQVEVLIYSRRFEDALRIADRVKALRPDYVPNLGNRARALFALGQKTEAAETTRFIRRNLDKNPRRDADSWSIWVLCQSGLRDEAVAHADELFKILPETSQQRGFVLGALGRFDEALPFLERIPPILRRRLYWDPMWDAWRDDPRFQQLMVKLGCAEEYKVARETLARMLKEQAAKK